MGNCMERCREGEEETMRMEQVDGEQKEEIRSVRKVGFVKENDDEFIKGGVKVKIVLTREELEWLMMQLKNNEGKKLEEILGELGRDRSDKKVDQAAWRPSLESIMETPEVHEMDRS